MKNAHLSLSLSRELWLELLRAALPVQLSGGEFALADNARSLVKQLQVRQRVAGLLEDRKPPKIMLRARDRARTVWHARRAGVYKRLDEILRVEGEWSVSLDSVGTELRYGRQRVAADAWVKATATGKIWMVRDNIEIPFTLEKRVGASVALGDIRYEPGRRAVIGELQDLGIFLGDGTLLQLLSRLAELGLQQQLPTVNPVPILKREQVEGLVGPLGGPLKLQMGVEDLELEINEDDMTLKVRFGFTQPQLTDQQQADADF